MARNILARLTFLTAAMPSNAPALTSASMTLRFTLRVSTRSQKSVSDRNGPPGRARGPDDLDRALAHALHRRQAEADGLAGTGA